MTFQRMGLGQMQISLATTPLSHLNIINEAPHDTSTKKGLSWNVPKQASRDEQGIALGFPTTLELHHKQSH